jgi:hypothetical protein
MCAAATTATTGRSAQDWRKQSHDDSRHRQAEQNAHSLCYHFRPPFLGVIGPW